MMIRVSWPVILFLFFIAGGAGLAIGQWIAYAIAAPLVFALMIIAHELIHWGTAHIMGIPVKEVIIGKDRFVVWKIGKVKISPLLIKGDVIFQNPIDPFLNA